MNLHPFNLSYSWSVLVDLFDVWVYSKSNHLSSSQCVQTNATSESRQRRISKNHESWPYRSNQTLIKSGIFLESGQGQSTAQCGSGGWQMSLRPQRLHRRLNQDAVHQPWKGYFHEFQEGRPCIKGLSKRPPPSAVKKNDLVIIHDIVNLGFHEILGIPFLKSL